MKYIIGLGNPGAAYRTTKHNVGFTVVGEVAKQCSIELDRERFSSIIGTGSIAGVPVTLVLPQTFMNLSGKAVEELFRSDIKKADDMLVICDDINLKLGRIRMRRKGSSGGQKGLESIITVLGRDDFARLRVGIETGVPKHDITHYVLTPFKRNQVRHVAHAITLAKDAVISWITDGPEVTMRKFNTKKLAIS